MDTRSTLAPRLQCHPLLVLALRKGNSEIISYRYNVVYQCPRWITKVILKIHNQKRPPCFCLHLERSVPRKNTKREEWVFIQSHPTISEFR